MAPQQLYANNSSRNAAVNSQAISVDYTLVYPGLLPDNPLYVLKVLRDRLVGFFISDPLKKSAFDLLQADKRLNAGVYLSQEPKIDEGLIVSTISKGENYFSESIDQLDLAKKQGGVVGVQVNTLEIAGKKHMQVLYDLQQNMPSTARAALQREINRVTDFEKRVVEVAKG